MNEPDQIQRDGNEQSDAERSRSLWKRRTLLIVLPLALLVSVIVSVEWYRRQLSPIEKQYVGYWHTVRDHGTNHADVYLAFRANRQFSSVTRVKGGTKPSTPGRPVTWRATEQKISLRLTPKPRELLPFATKIDHHGQLNVVSLSTKELTIRPASTEETYERIQPEEIPKEILDLLELN